MKKSICCLLMLIIMVCFPSCAKDSIAEVCAEAEQLLAAESGDIYWYEGEYRGVGGTYCYCVNAQLDSSTKASDYYEYVKALSANDVVAELYPQLKEILDVANIPVIIVFTEPDGQVFASYANETMEWVD